MTPPTVAPRPDAGFFARPLRDVVAGLDRALDAGWTGLLRVFVGLAAGWWLYVPIHELLHAAGCLAAGGTVTRLEIAPLYGGAVLAEVVPFVVAGGDYAGRLAGFDVGGNDGVYAATDLAPFLLTIFPGVWLLRRWGRAGRALRWGLILPFALAPFLSLGGDAYELGSLLISGLPPWSDPAARELLRGDDLFRRVALWATSDDAPWLGGLLATLAGVLWAFATYDLGRRVARWLERSGDDSRAAA